MNQALSKLQQKYRVTDPDAGDALEPDVVPPQAQGPGMQAFDPEATDWRGCASIVALRGYLDGQPGLGAYIGQGKDGRMTMRFVPPLGLDDDDGNRLRAAVVALDLLLAARDDIKRLVSEGKMRLKQV
jgi:hypothetical protein